MAAKLLNPGKKKQALTWHRTTLVQIQCLMQIIINRIALIMYDVRQVRRLKWSVTLFIGVINIAVFVIWMPARLQISPTWIAINSVWDRVEKGLLALLDLGLNLKFIYLVHNELIKHGLTKYRDLYRFNISMIFVSLSLDVSLFLLSFFFSNENGLCCCGSAKMANRAHRLSSSELCRFPTNRASCMYFESSPPP